MEKKKIFLKKPHFEGGKEFLKKFFNENMKYPTAALENKIEGDVVVKYKVTDRGEVLDVVVEHGIGYGCDEEAIRIVKLIKFQAVKNRGVRLTSGGRMKIPFRLPRKTKTQPIKMVYTTKKPQAEKQPGDKPVEPSSKTYSYTIKLK